MEFILFKDDARTGGSITLDEEEMEWILNSLRLMQEHQQRLATEKNGQELTRQDVQSSLGVELDSADAPPVDVGEMFRDQYSDVTNLREKLVACVGRDLTDG